jgi:hypothetical protein
MASHVVWACIVNNNADVLQRLVGVEELRANDPNSRFLEMLSHPLNPRWRQYLDIVVEQKKKFAGSE